MKKHLYHITSLLCLSFFAKSQTIFLNNPANHIVAYNPAFSAIHTYFNRNYSGKQITASSRIAQNQKDIQVSGQYFFDKQNIGLSLDYGTLTQNHNSTSKVGLGIGYQLLFFNEISTGWGIVIHYNNLQTNSNPILSIYNKEFTDTLTNLKSLDITFGGLINYERFLFGFSYQPKQLINIMSDNKSISNATQTLYFKTYRPITRNLNAILWYQAHFNKLYSNNEQAGLLEFQQHSIHVHLAGKKGLIGGLGSRITDFNYYSVIAKLGYNHRKWQILYGMEPYWLHAKYSEIIHELSFTYKFN